MFRTLFAFIVVVGVSTNLAAQATPAAAWSPQLTTHMTAWEAKTRSYTTFSALAELVRTNTIKQRDVKYDASLMLMKPQFMKLEITSATDKSDALTYYCDGVNLTELDAKAKRMTQRAMQSPRQIGSADNVVLDLLAGSLTAEAIKKRFAVSLKNEDEHYVYLQIVPQQPQDRAEFDQLTLVLYGPKLANRKWDYLPAVALFAKNDGMESEKWTFKEPKLNDPQVTKEKFVTPPLPKGWERSSLAIPLDPPTKSAGPNN